MATIARCMTVTIRWLPLVLAAMYAGGLIYFYADGWIGKESGSSPEGEAGNSLDRIVESLQNLPMNRAFHYGIFGIVFIWLISRFSLYNKIWRAFKDRREPEFMNWQDWEVIFELRKSAFHLRTRADLLVIVSLFVLFGGMYFVVFIIPKILSQDNEIAVESILENRYGQIRDIWSGTGWAKISDSSENDNRNQRYPDLLRADQSVNFVKPVQIVRQLINLEDGDEARVETTGSEFDNGSMIGTDITRESVEFIDIGQEVMVAEFSPNGQVGVIGGRSGAVFLTRDGGSQWSKIDEIEGLFQDSEWIDAAAFGHDGQIGVIVGDEGTVLVTDNQGEKWSKAHFSENGIGRRITAKLSPDGRIGVIGGTSGSVFLTRDGGNQWSEIDEIERLFRDSEWLAAAAFSYDGQIGVIAGAEGTVLVTRDEGKQWSEIEGPFRDRERIAAAAFSHDSQIGVIVGRRGTVLVTGNQGEDWSESRLGGDIGWGIAAKLSPDGRIGVIGDNAGTVFLTRDGGKKWRLLDSVGAAGELSDMSPDIKPHINLLEDKRVQVMMYTTVPLIDSEEGIDQSAWIDAIRSIPRRGERGDRLMTGAFSNGENVGAFGTRSGRVFLTVNRGARWDEQDDLGFESSEWMQFAAFSKDGKLAVIAGSEGTVTVARNIGSESRIQWSTVEAPRNVTDDLSMLWEEDDREEGQYNRNLYIHENAVIARIGRDYIDERSKDYYALVYFGEPDERPISELYQSIRKHSVMGDAEIIREIDSRIRDVDDLSNRNSGSPLGREISALLTRAVVLAILLFISQHLMRMSQYDMRLAAFWDSRANALLLFKNFARKKSRTFDRLVDSLAPDDYDFKSTRRMPHINLDVSGRRNR